MNTDEIKFLWNRWTKEADPFYIPNPIRVGIGVGKVMKACGGDDLLRKQVCKFLTGKTSTKKFTTVEMSAWIIFAASPNMSEAVRVILDDIQPQLLESQ